VKAVQKRIHLFAAVARSNHWITSRFRATVTKTDEQSRNEQSNISAGIDGQQDPERVREECKYHYTLWSDRGIKDPSKNHGDRKSQEPHLVDEAQLLGTEAERFCQLRKYSGPDTERKCCCDQGKATSVKKPLSVLIHCRQGLGLDGWKIAIL
jgi:hypothetical protein